MKERGRLEMVGKMRYTFASSGSPVEESVDYKKERKIHVLYLIYKNTIYKTK